MTIDLISVAEFTTIVFLFIEETLLLVNKHLIDNKNLFKIEYKELYLDYNIKNNYSLYYKCLLIYKGFELIT